MRSNRESARMPGHPEGVQATESSDNSPNKQNEYEKMVTFLLRLFRETQAKNRISNVQSEPN